CVGARPNRFRCSSAATDPTSNTSSFTLNVRALPRIPLCASPGETLPGASLKDSLRREGNRSEDGHESIEKGMSDLDFTIREQTASIIALAREFAQREIAPNIATWDEQESIPRSVITKLHESGLAGGVIPEKYGGAGMD